MAVHVMDRKASDNEYFHRDFHVSGDQGIRYVGEQFGDEAVKKYLTRFALAYYKPLIERVKAEGLSAMAKHITRIYEVEKAADAASIVLADDRLDVAISYCPAVRFMKSTGYEPSRWYVETTRTVNRVIAEACGYRFEMGEYDAATGATKYSFFRG